MTDKKTLFHYVPTVTGEYPGPDVMQQTEDAINQLGSAAIQASENSAEALLLAQQAKEASNTAVSNASSAKQTAEDAARKADNLERQVGDFGKRLTVAENQASNALATAQNASKQLDDVRAVAEDARATAEAAVDTANNAVSAAQDAATSATASATSAGQAQQAATDAQRAAEGSAESANAAKEIAREAAQTAQDAQAHASTSQQQAASALQSVSDLIAQNFVIRLYYSNLSGGETFSAELLHPSDGVKTGDFVISKDAKIFRISAVDDIEDETEDRPPAVMIEQEYSELVLAPDIYFASAEETAAGAVADKAIAPDTLKNEIDKVRLPPGIILPWANKSNTPPDGFLLLDNSIVEASDFPRLAALGTFPVKDGKMTLTAPPEGYALGFTQLAEKVMTIQDGKLPNITGAIYQFIWSNAAHDGVYEVEFGSTDKPGWHMMDNGQSNFTPYSRVSFDASRSNAFFSGSVIQESALLTRLIVSY